MLSIVLKKTFGLGLHDADEAKKKRQWKSEHNWVGHDEDSPTTNNKSDTSNMSSRKNESIST